MTEQPKSMVTPVWTGPERRAVPDQPRGGSTPEGTIFLPEPERHKRHLRPVWILLLEASGWGVASP